MKVFVSLFLSLCLIFNSYGLTHSELKNNPHFVEYSKELHQIIDHIQDFSDNLNEENLHEITSFLQKISHKITLLDKKVHTNSEFDRQTKKDLQKNLIAFFEDIKEISQEIHKQNKQIDVSGIKSRLHDLADQHRISPTFFEKVKNFYDNIPTWVKWTGLAIIVGLIGGIIYYVFKTPVTSETEQDPTTPNPGNNNSPNDTPSENEGENEEPQAPQNTDQKPNKEKEDDNSTKKPVEETKPDKNSNKPKKPVIKGPICKLEKKYQGIFYKYSVPLSKSDQHKIIDNEWSRYYFKPYFDKLSLNAYAIVKKYALSGSYYRVTKKDYNYKYYSDKKATSMNLSSPYEWSYLNQIKYFFISKLHAQKFSGGLLVAGAHPRMKSEYKIQKTGIFDITETLLKKIEAPKRDNCRIKITYAFVEIFKELARSKESKLFITNMGFMNRLKQFMKDINFVNTQQTQTIDVKKLDKALTELIKYAHKAHKKYEKRSDRNYNFSTSDYFYHKSYGIDVYED